MVVWAGILLGPEATPGGVGAHGSRLVGIPSSLVGCGFCGVGVVAWWLVENYTVDASIFVVKLLRAYGGCLGTRSR